jgi:hypothetical protein
MQKREEMETDGRQELIRWVPPIMDEERVFVCVREALFLD